MIQEYFQPKIGRKIRILSLGRKNNILIKKKSVFEHLNKRKSYVSRSLNYNISNSDIRHC